MTALLVTLALALVVTLTTATILDGHAWMRRPEPQPWHRPMWADIPPAPLRTMPDTYSDAIRVTSHRTDRQEIAQ